MTESNELWGAIYMPATQRDDPSISGFKSREEAEKYTRRFWCRHCRSEYARALRWKRKGVDIYDIEKQIEDAHYDTVEASMEAYFDFLEEYGSFYPACEYEWIIDVAGKIDACETTEDMMRLIGYDGD